MGWRDRSALWKFMSQNWGIGERSRSFGRIPESNLVFVLCEQATRKDGSKTENHSFFGV